MPSNRAASSRLSDSSPLLPSLNRVRISINTLRAGPLSERKASLRATCPVLEGERTYGRHREIDAIDPERTWRPIDS
jgi:hypothetical protein